MRFLTVAETAERLGVRRETVYAYTSRGLLTSVRGVERRGSRFAADEVEALAARGRGAPSGVVERIRTAVTRVSDEGLLYRGMPAVELAAEGTLEDAARLLWNLPGRPVLAADPDLAAVARAAVAVLPDTTRLTDRLRVAVAAIAAGEPLRADLAPAAVVRSASTLLGTTVAALGGTGAAAPLHHRLWPVLGGSGLAPDVLRMALVLLADHGLAVSTVAARVAASARADVHAVVSAGLGALDGPAHGLVSTQAHRFLADARADPIATLAERLRAGERIPGFGHAVYTGPDPRAQALLERLRTDAPAAPVLATVDAVAARMEQAPNVDLAVAALMHAHGLRPDAGEAIFAVARTVGWVAHALEEYAERALRFRPVGVYVGPGIAAG